MLLGLRGTVTTVLVTHDPVDAMALADHVLVVEEGRVVQAWEVPPQAGSPGLRVLDGDRQLSAQVLPESTRPGSWAR